MEVIQANLLLWFPAFISTRIGSYIVNIGGICCYTATGHCESALKKANIVNCKVLYRYRGVLLHIRWRYIWRGGARPKFQGTGNQQPRGLFY